MSNQSQSLETSTHPIKLTTALVDITVGFQVYLHISVISLVCNLRSIYIYHVRFLPTTSQSETAVFTPNQHQFTLFSELILYDFFFFEISSEI